VYSAGRQIRATNGYVLHALDVTMEKSGRVTINEEGLFQVEKAEAKPPFACALPQGEPAASIVIRAEALRQTTAGHGVYALASTMITRRWNWPARASKLW
jgi:hypothetical protein